MFHNGRSGGNGRAASPAPGIAGLIMEFGERWSIAYDIALSVWSAERRSPDGRTRWFIAHRKPADLAARLADAEAGQ
jgi:hypothetical protein